MSPLVIGVDFGTDSVRAELVDASTGAELSAGVAAYPRWAEGRFCDPGAKMFRQHPLDYVEAFERSVTGALRSAPEGSAARIRAISIDTTGSTPCAVDRGGTPLSLRPEFAENPNAMFVLWKDHTAVREAEEINSLSRTWGGIDYTRYEGGVYSSEWFWAKILHVLRADTAVRAEAYSWVEHCDWFPALLTGTTDPLAIQRSRCAAGHKAMWHESFSGLPSEEFLTRLDPLLSGLRARLFRHTATSDLAAGTISAAWAAKLGLPADVLVGVGAFDAHMGAVGGEIDPYVMTKIMGTSTCDMIVVPAGDMEGRLVAGICGQVDGSILPGMVGMEAGQSAFGDVYAWFKEVLMWPLEELAGRSAFLTPDQRRSFVEEAEAGMVETLSAAALRLPVDVSGPLALDWMNGRRTPDADQTVRGAIAGLTLGTDAPRIFRALVEATAFGARRIMERFRTEGVRIDAVTALGGVPKRSPFIMQVVADVMGVPIRVPRADQPCALGAAMFAATVAGLYPTVEEAKRAMGSGIEKEYRPDPERAAAYDALYERYCRLASYEDAEAALARRRA
jgi:L-ribulokinase